MELALRRLFRWFGRFTEWFFVERLKFWITVVVLLVVTLTAFFLSYSSLKSRFVIAGMLLQLCGIGTVAWGLRDTRKLFERPNLRALMFAWFKRFPRWRENLVLIPGTADVRTSARIAGVGRVILPPDTPLDKRVAALEAEVAQISESLYQMQRKHEETTRALSSADQVENRERKAEDEEIRKLLTEAAAGGLHLEMMGICWLFFGVLFSSVSSL